MDVDLWRTVLNHHLGRSQTQQPYRVRVTNANTHTKADIIRISQSFVNIGLASINMCEFYWINVKMIIVLNIILRNVFVFLEHVCLHLLFS